jgi:oxaloacetate decarboxylase beta subunit
MELLANFFREFYNGLGIVHLTVNHVIMMVIGILFIYLGLVKKFEPLLLIPIGFGMIIANLPLANLASDSIGPDGIPALLNKLYMSIKYVVIPPLIYMCIGALTDFGPLIARPSTFLIGAIGGQLGIFTSFGLALLAGKIIPGLTPFTIREAASIGIIGSSDGPTTIFLASKLAPHILPIVAVAAYSYMALVPLIQPPIMRLLTTAKERVVVMEEAKPVSKRMRIIFPIGMTIVTILLIPGAGELIACMMLGNLIRECGILERYNKTLQNEFLNILTLVLALSIGSTCSAETILNLKTVVIIVLGLMAFAMGTVGGILFAKVLYKISGGKVNPLIGNAGISAMPMAARVTQKVGQEYNRYNHLLMHAMGPLTASTIGSAMVAGIFLAFLHQ